MKFRHNNKPNKKYFYYIIDVFYKNQQIGKSAGVFSTFEKHLKPCAIEKFWKDKYLYIKEIYIINSFEISKYEYDKLIIEMTQTGDHYE